MKNTLKMAGLFLLPGVAILLFPACEAAKSNTEYIPPAIVLPANIKTLSVRPFQNETSQPDINNKLWLATTNGFIRDGRISYVNLESNADGVVIGVIKQYIETPLSFDSNLVATEYQIRMIVDLKFLDLSQNQYLWEEPSLDRRIRYFAPTQPGGKTVEQAREELYDRFAEDIVKRTLDGFGSVTGSSRKNVPQEIKPDPTPPDYQGTSPF